jgi:hypothetical protein
MGNSPRIPKNHAGNFLASFLYRHHSILSSFDSQMAAFGKRGLINKRLGCGKL